MLDYSTWGDAWGFSWGDAWGCVEAAVVTPDLPIEYSAAWLPTIHLDKDGKRISPKKLQKRVIEAVAEPQREKVTAAFREIEKKPVSTVDPVIMDRMASDLRAISLLLPEIQVNLLQELRQVAFEIQERADDERDIEMLLLAM